MFVSIATSRALSATEFEFTKDNVEFEYSVIVFESQPTAPALQGRDADGTEAVRRRGRGGGEARMS